MQKVSPTMPIERVTCRNGAVIGILLITITVGIGVMAIVRVVKQATFHGHSVGSASGHRGEINCVITTAYAHRVMPIQAVMYPTLVESVDDAGRAATVPNPLSGSWERTRFYYGGKRIDLPRDSSITFISPAGAVTSIPLHPKYVLPGGGSSTFTFLGRTWVAPPMPGGVDVRAMAADGLLPDWAGPPPEDDPRYDRVRDRWGG